MENETNNDEKQIIIPSEIIPEIIPIIPISQRPIFPGMMMPLVLTGEKMINTTNEIFNADEKVGGVVLIKNPQEEGVTSADLYSVGVSIKILKVAPLESF